MKVHDWRLAYPVAFSWLALICLQNFVGQEYQWAILIFLIPAAVIALIFIAPKPEFAFALTIITTVIVRFLTNQEPIESDATYHGVFAWIQHMHQVLLQESSQMPGYGGQLIAGLTIGDDSLVSESLDRSMKTTSLSHLTAISGANCSILVACVVVVAGAFQASRLLRAAIGSSALLLYVLVIGPQPSVLRAALMAVVVIITLSSGRPALGLPVLATVTYLLLLWDPSLASEYGFILSVVATAGLITLTEPITSQLSRLVPSLCATLLAIPIAAQIVCQPITVLLSPSLQTYGVVANLLAAPAAPVATVIGLALCVSLVAAPALTDVLLWLQWLPATWISSCARVFASLPGAKIEVPSGFQGFLLVLGISASLLIAIVTKSQKLRFVSVISTFLLVGVVCVSGLIASVIQKSRIPPDWVIASCDVGQGDALIVRSHNSYALIDAGRYPDRLERCLEMLNVNHIEMLVLSHFDMDHVGGVAGIEKMTSNVLVGPSVDRDSDQIIRDFIVSGATVTKAMRGLSGNFGAGTWRVLWPDSSRNNMQSGNDGSVTIEFEIDGVTTLFTGDLGRQSQDALLATGQLSNIDVVKVAHHGSADQSARFYETIDPEVALFSVGKENSYGHPRKQTLELLKDVDATVARTDQDGLILVRREADVLRVWTEH